jgi:histidinol-phosphatase
VEWSATLRRGTESDLQGWLELALAACDEADVLARAAFRRDLVVSTKPDRSLVTTVDTAIERFIRERIRARYPGHGLIGEEYGEQDGAGRVRWYIDPIDGTHNFVRGIPLFATLLAVEQDGELQVGVMSAPALGERWYAARGAGAWSVATHPGTTAPPVPRRIRVSLVEQVEHSQVVYGSVASIDRSAWAKPIHALIERSWRDRGFGDFWSYALVAEGAAEAMLEIGVNPWDIAAAQVVVEEAGGRLTDFAGERSIEGRTVMASNGRIHEALVDALSGSHD